MTIPLGNVAVLTRIVAYALYCREGRVNKPKEATQYLKEIVDYTFAHQASNPIFTKHQCVSSFFPVHRKL